MTTLKQIEKQESIVTSEKQKLWALEKSYISEARKYPDGYYIRFDDYGKIKTGEILRADYQKEEEGSRVKYTAMVVTKSGVRSKSDRSFYYILEGALSPEPVLNALNNR